MASSIPMSPEQLPVQGYRIDIPLSPKPANFNPFRFDRDAHKALVPSRMPPLATYLAQLEWAWGPLNNAIAKFSLTLNRAKSHWIGWMSGYNDEDFPSHWDTDPSLIAERGTANRDVIAVHMLRAMLEDLRDNADYNRFRWINRGGYLGVYRIEAIGDEAWGSKPVSKKK